jgi:hypothetical protein
MHRNAIPTKSSSNETSKSVVQATSLEEWNHIQSRDMSNKFKAQDETDELRKARAREYFQSLKSRDIQLCQSILLCCHEISVQDQQK